MNTMNNFQMTQGSAAFKLDAFEMPQDAPIITFEDARRSRKTDHHAVESARAAARQQTRSQAIKSSKNPANLVYSSAAVTFVTLMLSALIGL